MINSTVASARLNRSAEYNYKVMVKKWTAPLLLGQDIVLLTFRSQITIPNLSHFYTKPNQHTSWGSCFTAGKFSCLTWADQSPLSHSVVQAPSVSLVSGTISMYLTTQESSVTSAGRLVDLVSSFRTESDNILDQQKMASVTTKKHIKIRVKK